MLACKGEEGQGCLTNAQVDLVRTLMSPLKDPHTNTEIFPGWEAGSELGWGAVIAGPEPTPLTVEHYKFVVFADPKWDWRTFDLQKDLARAEKVDNGTINAINPDLTSFVRRRGKLLMFHGWSDPLVPPRASVNYYTSVLDRMGGPAKTADWVRLFMVPGMAHCGGGEGPNTFDTIAALEAWVERGRPPDRIVAARVANGRVERRRPLCPYPQLATRTAGPAARTKPTTSSASSARHASLRMLAAALRLRHGATSHRARRSRASTIVSHTKRAAGHLRERSCPTRAP